MKHYWVVGGEYRDCGFSAVVPGTHEMFGPFEDRAQGASPSGGG